MPEFKVGDKVLIDCSHNPTFDPNSLQGQIVLICNWPSGAGDKYGCAYGQELQSMKVSAWCHAEQLRLLAQEALADTPQTVVKVSAFYQELPL